ncbi:MAG: metal-sulfur cluster assembly factor [Longimicrobiales bacterium]|nr:metal-sulfur cluster assembly factor [Longimicrobiales bacterium]
MPRSSPARIPVRRVSFTSSISYRSTPIIMAVTEKDIRTALKGVKDPELGLDLIVLGLIYDIEVEGDHVDAIMSLTSPMCPVAGQIVEDVKTAIEGVEGVESAEVELTFDPPWTPERISPLIRASLGL